MTPAEMKQMYASKMRTIPEILSTIRSGDVIFTTNNYSEPGEILSHLHEIAENVENVKVWKGRSGLYPFMVDPHMKGHIEMYTYFFGPTFYRNSQPMGLVDLVPVDLQSYFTVAVSGHPANICIAAVTPMDKDGNFHLPLNHAADGLGVLDAIENHKTIYLEVNPNMHHARGAVAINIKDVTALTEVARPEFVTPTIPATPIEEAIGKTVASLVHDGDTIQLGIGGIPNAVGMFLKDKNDLGIHTEMFTTSMMELIKSGVITGKYKSYDKGLHVFAFAEGEPELYPFLQEREDCLMRTGRDVVDPFNIARHDNMVSINTLVEIDLTGQICAESVGPKQISGSGGAFCFAYGCYRAKNGRNILAFPSRTKNGDSKIKSMLTHGAVVTIPRNYADTIVTEYGIAKLRARTIAERASQLIAIAHPDDRDALTQQAKELHYLP